MDWDSLPAWFDVKTLKKFLQIGTKAAYELTRQKDFPAIKVVRSIRISRDGLRAWQYRKLGFTQEEPNNDSMLRCVK